MHPLKISMADDKTLSIAWDDGVVGLYPLARLRRKCPCATCTTEAQAHGSAYIPLYSKDALTIDRLVPVGFYAIQLFWKDGHHTGIYTYDYLRTISD